MMRPATMPSATLIGAVDVCMFCDLPTAHAFPGGLRCYCGRGEPCPNCGMLTCICRPAPCCGAPWSPMDWAYRDECYICAAPVERRYDPVAHLLTIKVIDYADGTPKYASVPAVMT